jgi:transcription elongation factor Elf1
MEDWMKEGEIVYCPRCAEEHKIKGHFFEDSETAIEKTSEVDLLLCDNCYLDSKIKAANLTIEDPDTFMDEVRGREAAQADMEAEGLYVGCGGRADIASDLEDIDWIQYEMTQRDEEDEQAR